MVKRILERLTAPVRGLHQAAYLLAGLTLASQALALLRDRTFASVFGAGHTLDLYYAAFRVPDLVFALVSSLVSAYVIIPRIARMEREEMQRLLSQAISFLVLFGGALCVVLAVFMPQFLSLLYPDFATSSQHAAFVLLARLLLIQPLLLGFSGVIASVTQVHRRFFLYALSPVLYNLGIIFGATVLYPRMGLPGIGVGVVLGAIGYGAVHIPVIAGAHVVPKLTRPRFSAMLPIIRDSVPRSLALGIGSFTLLAVTSIASRLGTGSVSVFTLASNLEAVPLALIGSSYAVAAFPALSEASADERKDEFTRILSASARHIILWSLVFLGLIAVLRAHLVRVILGSGAFGWDATRLTAALLAILAVGLAAQGLVLLFSRALYAARQSWRPLFYQLAGSALTIALAVTFIHMPASGFPSWLASLLRVGDVSGTSILLVALAFSCGQIFLALLSLIALRDAAPGLAPGLYEPLAGGLIAGAAGGAAAYGTLAVAGGFAPLTTTLAVFTQGFIAGVVGLAVSALALLIIGNREFRDIVAAATRIARARGILKPSAEEPAQP